MTSFQKLLSDHPDIERELSRLAQERAKAGPLTEEQAREALGLTPPVPPSPKKKRRLFFAFADVNLL